MSDYLGRIVERLRSPKATAMQPIWPSRFEPVGADAPGFSTQDLEQPTSPQTEVRRREQLAEPRHPIRPAEEGEILRNTPALTALKSARQSPAGSQVVAEASKEIGHRLEAPQAESGVPFPVEHNVVEKMRVALHPLRETQGLGTSAQLPAQGRGFDAGTGQRAAPSRPPGEEPSISHQMSAREEQEESSVRVERRTIIEEVTASKPLFADEFVRGEVERRTIIQEAPAPPPEVIAALKPAWPPADRRLLSHATTSRTRDLHSSERSEIRVTIGRIEVRAITTPPSALPAQKPPARQPKVSLDDYLRFRNGIGP
jgi:hypothetical protein